MVTSTSPNTLYFSGIVKKPSLNTTKMPFKTKSHRSQRIRHQKSSSLKKKNQEISFLLSQLNLKKRRNTNLTSPRKKSFKKAKSATPVNSFQALIPTNTFPLYSKPSFKASGLTIFFDSWKIWQKETIKKGLYTNDSEIPQGKGSQQSLFAGYPWTADRSVRKVGQASTNDIEECSVVVKSNGILGTLIHGDPARTESDYYTSNGSLAGLGNGRSPRQEKRCFKRVIRKDSKELKQQGLLKGLVTGGVANDSMSSALSNLFIKALRENGIEPTILWGQTPIDTGKYKVALRMDAQNDEVHISLRDSKGQDIDTPSLQKVLARFQKCLFQPGTAIKIKERIHSHIEANDAFSALNRNP